jgi:hypothetical protein
MEKKENECIGCANLEKESKIIFLFMIFISQHVVNDSRI